MSVPDTVLNRGGSAFGDENVGSGSMLGTVLERNRVNIIMPTPPEKALKLDDGGDGGGIGKNNHNGGGGGDGGGDDDDDFFGEEGDGDGDGEGGPAGAGFFRLRIPELFDRAALAAVLQEWFKTVADLPLFIRRSVEMGLFSSAQLVRFLSMDVRPNVTRAVSRRLPTSVSAAALICCREGGRASARLGVRIRGWPEGVGCTFGVGDLCAPCAVFETLALVPANSALLPATASVRGTCRTNQLASPPLSRTRTPNHPAHTSPLTLLDRSGRASLWAA
jgi:hypothetical protein